MKMKDIPKTCPKCGGVSIGVGGGGGNPSVKCRNPECQYQIAEGPKGICTLPKQAETRRDPESHGPSHAITHCSF